MGILYHIETSHLICDADRMTGFWCESLLVGVYEQTFITYDIVIIQPCYNGVKIYFIDYFLT